MTDSSMPPADAPSSGDGWLLLATTRVRDLLVRPPTWVDADTDLVTLCRRLSQAGETQALVRDGERLGIFTTTDLRDALLRPEPASAVPVGEVARFDIVDVTPDADLMEALWLMASHRVHRLVVRDGDGVLGLLGQIDLVGFVVNHPGIVARRIASATAVDELAGAARGIDAMVEVLQDSGVRIERIARVVSELNGRLFARLWSLVAPPDLVANSCLLVMGSEGRGEQVLKTDQDNALLLRDGFDVDDAVLRDAADRFNAALAAFGWPRCPGDIMLTTPLWRQSLAAFQTSIAGWIHGGADGPGPEGPMRLAIFVDAHAVAGDASLLDAALAHLDRVLTDHDAFHARFARAVDQFGDGHPWWTRLGWRRDEHAIDLKKLAVFPIVHGVRALALRHRVRAHGTVARLQVLVARGVVDAALAHDVEEALHFVMALRLKHQLRVRRAGGTPDNRVRPADLDTLERDPLQDSLAIVKRFRGFLSQHFRLDLL